ncbi:hypothetical protein ABPG75_007448 [Micractinium tetrahymenae]
MAACAAKLRLDGALAGRASQPTLIRSPMSIVRTKMPGQAPTRVPLVLQRVSGGCPGASRTLQRRWWRASTAAREEPAEGGGGDDNGDGSGGGGGGGSSGDGRSSEGEGEDNNPGLSGNMWMLAGAAATVLAIFLVRQKSRQKQRPQRGQSQGAAAAAGSQQPSSDELATLTRLTQEAFAELVKVKERLGELEEDAGLGPDSAGSAPAGATALSAGSGGRGAARGRPGVAGSPQQQHPHGRHRLAGVLRLGGGLLWAQEGGAGGAAGVLRAAGLKLGADALLQLAAVVRGGRDSVHAECRLDAAAERASLRKVLYNCRLGSRLRLILSPFGARGRDAAYTLNPLAGQGLSGMVRDGSPLHQPVLGSLAGVALEASRAWFNAGYFARALPSGGAAASLLAQLVVAPTNSLSLGLALLEHRSEASTAGTAGTAAAAAAAAGGAAGVADQVSGSGSGAALVGALGRAAGTAADALGISAACEARQLGALLAWRLGQDAVVHGWAAADGAEVERRLRTGQLGAAAQPAAWGLVLGSYPDGSGNGWALGVGRSAAAAAAIAGGSSSGSSASGDSGGSGGGESPLLPNLFELSLQWNMGEGLLLSPGLLLVTRGGGKDPLAFLGLRSTWAF